MNDAVNPTKVKKGDKIKVFHYIGGKMVPVTVIEGGSIKRESGDLEIGIKFKNGDTGWAYWEPKKNRWEVGEN